MDKNNGFSNLTEVQYGELTDAVSLIAILIAGADGEIDNKELDWAEKLMHMRTYVEPAELNNYYKDVEENFHNNFDSFIEILPNEKDTREEEIAMRLSRLNDVLAILPNPLAYKLYNSFTSFAEHIAKSSGGFLRYGSISHEERQWVELDMITPVKLQIDEEE